MKAPYDDLNFVRELSKYKWCRANLTVIKRFLLPDWSVYGKISVKSRKIGKRNTLKSQKKKKKGYETEKNLNMESDQPEIKVIAPLHEIPPPPTTENIMKTLTKEDAIVMNYDERDEAGPPGKADMEAPKGTGNTIMNDTPDVVSRYENKLDDEIIEVMTKTSSLENWKEESISQGIFPYPLIYIWNCICNGSRLWTHQTFKAKLHFRISTKIWKFQ